MGEKNAKRRGARGDAALRKSRGFALTPKHTLATPLAVGGRFENPVVAASGHVHGLDGPARVIAASSPIFPDAPHPTRSHIALQSRMARLLSFPHVPGVKLRGNSTVRDSFFLFRSSQRGCLLSTNLKGPTKTLTLRLAY